MLLRCRVATSMSHVASWPIWTARPIWRALFVALVGVGNRFELRVGETALLDLVGGADEQINDTNAFIGGALLSALALIALVLFAVFLFLAVVP